MIMGKIFKQTRHKNIGEAAKQLIQKAEYNVQCNKVKKSE